MLLNDNLYFSLPYRIRSKLSKGLIVRHLVGPNHLLVPASIDLEPWKPGWMSDLLTRVLPHLQGTFIDVGVNRLQTFFDLRSVDLNRSYVGFEPNPACSSYAWEVFRLNTSLDSLIVSCALAAESGVLDLWVTRGSEFDSCATTIRELRPGRAVERIAAPAATADQVLSGLKIDEISLLKIDVEGGELSVLRGAISVLSGMRPIVLCEVLLRDKKADPELYLETISALSELLEKVNYRAYQILKDERSSQVLSIHRITQFPNNVWNESNSEECDYFFCPAERAAFLEGIVLR